MMCDTCKHNNGVTVIDTDTGKEKVLCLAKILMAEDGIDCAVYEKRE